MCTFFSADLVLNNTKFDNILVILDISIYNILRVGK